jgi:hypothetical protein
VVHKSYNLALSLSASNKPARITELTCLIRLLAGVTTVVKTQDLPRRLSTHSATETINLHVTVLLTGGQENWDMSPETFLELVHVTRMQTDAKL